ncbi:hypothetical protein HELRODRAFT_160150 [Helobdella robusta]|uniref:Uncharacterized protein n=1 Tax=Helobdella robusta TaxID=6412 RepID=T1EPW1_HELRO|nr:hypothetical protein HELRODRAFT_160150 [Helobdella robusta]ESO06035.1 hypothetical protein HELRODRAFT_160150 [Helobdella robusta]
MALSIRQKRVRSIPGDLVHGVAVQGPVDGLATGTPLYSVAVQGAMDGRITCRPRDWRFGTWNVGTLTGRSLEKVEELQRRMVDVAALQEIRWKGEGTRPLSANQKELLMKLNHSSSNHFFSSDNSYKNLYLQLPLLFADCLQELDLSGNALSCVPEALSTMKELKRIDLSNNPALKDLPEGLCDLFNLEMLLLEGIEFSDVKLTEMAKNGFSTKMVQAYLRKRNKVCVQYHRLQVAILGKKKAHPKANQITKTYNVLQIPRLSDGISK